MRVVLLNFELMHNAMDKVTVDSGSKSMSCVCTGVLCMYLFQLLWCTTVSWCVATWTKQLLALAPRRTSFTSSCAPLVRITPLMHWHALPRSVQLTFVSCVYIHWSGVQCCCWWVGCPWQNDAVLLKANSSLFGNKMYAVTVNLSNVFILGELQQ